MQKRAKIIKKRRENLVFHPATHTQVRSKKDNKKLIATNSCTIFWC